MAGCYARTMRAIILLLLSACACFGQLSSELLPIWVSYQTQTATAKLSPELKAEVVQLGKDGVAAAVAGKTEEARKSFAHGMVLMRGQQWTPAAQFHTSQKLEIDHAVWEKGQTVTLRLVPQFAPDEPIGSELSAIAILDPGGKELGQWTGVRPGWSASFPAPELPTGSYKLSWKLNDLPDRTLSVIAAPGARLQASQLQSRASKLAVKDGPALPTAQYDIALYEMADRSLVDPASIDLSKELANAAELLGSLEQGANPYSKRTGDMHRAYRSKADGELQPYRLFVPKSYDETKPFPLFVALHGMGGNENTLFDRYGPGALKVEAEKHGYIVVTPKGRGPASMYRGTAEQDVLDVLAEIRRDYRIDANRIYLGGHSMGAFGTWSIAMAHPEIFAALAPVSGGGSVASMGSIKAIPQLVVHGDADPTVNVNSSRSMVEAGTKAGAEIKYVEVPGGGHNDVYVPAIPQMFEWFNAHPKKAKPASPPSLQ